MNFTTPPIPRAAALATICMLAIGCARPAPETIGAPAPEPPTAEPLPAPPLEEQPTVEAPLAEPTPAEQMTEIRAESWTGPGPAPLPGAILPERRIVAYYGTPLSQRMGILGEIPPERMLEQLDGEVAKWNAADPGTPAIPALHLIAVVAHADPGADGKYRGRVSGAVIERVTEWPSGATHFSSWTSSPR